MRPGIMNLLMILSVSETHEEVDLDSAVSSIFERVWEGDKNFLRARSSIV
jgi:hypothetical protein